MTEYLCRISADLPAGTFELDCRSNTVCLRMSIHAAGVGLSLLLFRNLVFHHPAVMDPVFAEMLGMMAGNRASFQRLIVHE